MLSTISYAQTKTWIVVGGDKPPAIVNDNEVVKYFDTMYLDILIPDTVSNIVLVTGDHKMTQDKKIYRQLVYHYNTGRVDTHMVRTDQQMQVWHYNHYMHKRIEMSEPIVKQ